LIEHTDGKPGLRSKRSARNFICVLKFKMNITYDMITKVDIKIVEKKRIKGEEIPTP